MNVTKFITSALTVVLVILGAMALYQFVLYHTVFNDPYTLSKALQYTVGTVLVSGVIMGLEQLS